jgi:peptide/nickel transport system permease protein
VAVVVAEEPPLTPRRLIQSAWRSCVNFYKVMRANPLSFVGFVLVAITLILAAVVVFDPSLIVPYGAAQDTGVYREPPTLLHWPPSIAHPFGTDQGGRDIYSDVMLALPLDLGIGIGIAGTSVIMGGMLGLIAGYWDKPGTLGGACSTVIMRVTDVFLAFPSLILALAIVASIGRGIWSAFLAIQTTWWPFYVRLVRGEVLEVKHLPYISAARAAGVRDSKILTSHVLRNVLDPIIVYFTLDIGTVLVTFSTISFVGAGIPFPGPVPEWGSIMSYYQGNFLLSQYWWYIAFPAAAIFMTALAYSLLGDGLRDVLDPRTRRALTQTAPTHEPPAELPSAAAAPTESEAAAEETEAVEEAEMRG